MTVSRGDVVLVHVKFSSGAGGKVRPSLVVQSDHNNRRLQDTIIALITRSTQRAKSEPTQLFVEISTPEGQQSGLLQDSAVKCEHLETVLQADIQRIVGSLPTTLMARINDCLKASLDLP
jgi:mRNA interferase MazF